MEAIQLATEEEKLWTRRFVLITIFNFLIFMSTYLIMATMPLFIQHIGGNKFMAGAVSGVFTIVGFLTRPYFGKALDEYKREKVLIIGSIILFIPMFCYNAFNAIFLIFTVYAFSLLLTRTTTGRLADRIGNIKVIIPGLTLLIVALILLIGSDSLIMFIVAAVFYGLGFGSVQPVLNALVLSFAPVNRRGLANATFLAAMDIGMGIGALIWGFISLKAGLVYIYIISPFLIVLSIIVCLTVVRKKINKQVN